MLLDIINHQLSNNDDADLIIEHYTFIFEGALYCKLPHLNGSHTIVCINMFDNGSEYTSDIK